ncbi:efflux RND transporter periplasmic adaptor subunit [Rhodonellum sp.]|uniref:efflux RND transporter periplasmic adaptor subunit n=1 Tax=Rhodonellum sp. TaxID=2231180 RepID=UPI00271B9A89|nr:efflux RND transporter periplasmic adaptor subunit [Rhodonellum sp.]MDO9550962.1 efflux RND transporter periplasmic adaptor subunit [Rhodonellum sp.]
MVNQKNIIVIVLGCLFFGGVIGWMIRGNDGAETHEHIAEDGTVYTCSMHPQIRQNEPGQCPICGMALTPLSQGASGGDPYIFEMTAEAAALSNVMTTRVKSGNAENQIRLTGKIKADEQRIYNLAANYSGRIDQLYVNFTGQEIKKGQKLATIYSPDLVNAQKELLETAKMKASNPLLYEAAKEKLRLWKMSDAQISAMEQKNEVQTQFDIFSEASGVVVSRNISMGDFVNRGTVLFEIVDLSSVWVLLDAYESDLAAIKVGDNVIFTLQAIPGREFPAKVTYIDPMLNPNTRTLSIRAEAKNTGMLLKPEMFVNGLIKTSGVETMGGLIVPKSAILWTGKRSVVYIQKGNKEAPAFEMREVTLGPRAGESYLIAAGLEEGEEVVTNGVFSIDAAAQLGGNYSMMGKPVSKTIQVPEAFKNQLGEVLKTYILLKDVLIQSDPRATQTQADKFLTNLLKVEMSLLEKNAHDVWMPLFGGLKTNLENLKKSDDLATQRIFFQKISDGMIESVDYFGVTEASVYKQYCPMADNDKGAYWLSLEKEIKNPYFGAAMLTCGEVKGEYKAEMDWAKPKNVAPIHLH